MLERFKKLLLLSVVMLALTACKIQIDVPVGGKVVSQSGTYSCQANRTCTIDVNDTFFDENFLAVADSGYRFAGWRQKNRYLCGGSTESCELYTTSFPGNDSLLTILESNERFYLEPVFVKSNTTNQSLSQSYRHSNSFPEAYIRESWDADLHITSVAGNDGAWTVVMSRVAGFSSQSYFTDTSFPRDDISSAWEADRSITEVAFNNGSWFVVTTGGTGLSSQRWATRGSFPEDEIDAYWNEGYYITDLAYGDGLWAVVASSVSGFGGQAYRHSGSFPESFISQYWDLGYEITELSYGGGSWVVVMTETNGGGGQSWATGGEFPEQDIDAAWNAGRDILDVVAGDSVYAVVASQSLAELIGGVTGSGGSGSGGGGSGTSNLAVSFSDACNDGRSVSYKFFDKTNDLVWPGATEYWYTNSYNTPYSHNLSCRTGANICYGAETDSWYWGVGLDGNGGCESCCVSCDDVSVTWNVGC